MSPAALPPPALPAALATRPISFPARLLPQGTHTPHAHPRGQQEGCDDGLHRILQHIQVVPHQRLPREGQVGSAPLLQVGVLLGQSAQHGLGVGQGLEERQGEACVCVWCGEAVNQPATCASCHATPRTHARTRSHAHLVTLGLLLAHAVHAVLAPVALDDLGGVRAALVLEEGLG